MLVDEFIAQRSVDVEQILTHMSKVASSSHHIWSGKGGGIFFKTMMLHWISDTTYEADHDILMSTQ